MSRRGHVEPFDAPFQRLPDGSGGEFRVPIGPHVGAEHVEQVIARFPAGAVSEILRKAAEEVAYVVSGRGRAEVDGRRFELEPGSALLIPPGAQGSFHSMDALELVLVVSPPMRFVEDVEPAPGHAPPASTNETLEQPLPAGDDRSFKLLIDPRHGARNVTQFAGFIERSHAPLHVHTYEEAIYILEGQGIVHVDGRREPIRAGSSIFLPPGTPHCLENASAGVLRLLGVFSPPGSPAGKQDAEPER